MSFFDAPWHIVLLLFAALILFGSSRLPGAAKALGSSMNIFKKSFKGDDEGVAGQPGQGVPGPQAAGQPTYTPPAPPQITSGPAAPTQQAQIDALQRQLNDLQKQQTGPADTPSQTRPS